MKKKLSIIILSIIGVILLGTVSVSAMSNFIDSEVRRIVGQLERDMNNYTNTFEDKVEDDINNRREEISQELDSKAHEVAGQLRSDIEGYYDAQIDSIVGSNEDLEVGKQRIKEEAVRILENEKAHIDQIIENYFKAVGRE